MTVLVHEVEPRPPAQVHVQSDDSVQQRHDPGPDTDIPPQIGAHRRSPYHRLSSAIDYRLRCDPQGLPAVRCVILAITVIHFSRAPTALRACRLAVALSVAAAGSGLPMCVSLLAQAAAPCDMHSSHNSAATHEHAAHLTALVARGSGQAGHEDAAGLGCAAGSTCPTGSPATAVWAKVSVGLPAASRTGVLGPSSSLVSYLAPPLSPPPQA